MSKLLYFLIPIKRILYFLKKIFYAVRQGLIWLLNSNEHTNFSFYLKERQIKHISFILSKFFEIEEISILKKFNELQKVILKKNKNSKRIKTVDLDLLPKWDYRMIPYILLKETKIENIFEFGIDQGRTGYLVWNLIDKYKLNNINYVGVEYNSRKGILIEDRLNKQINLIYSKVENVLESFENSDLENSIIISSTHEFNSEKFLFDYLSEKKIFPKIIISDETSTESPYRQFIEKNIYEDIIFPIEDPNNFLDTMYIGIAKISNK